MRRISVFAAVAAKVEAPVIFKTPLSVRAPPTVAAKVPLIVEAPKTRAPLLVTATLSVSYTHLDVYKRQDAKIATL